MKNKLSSSQTVVLDALRGLAALVVLFGHVYSRLPGDFSFGKTLPWQSLAVVVFFWLSGFLIAYHCLTKTVYTFKDYLVDRFCRIYVIYIPVLAGSCLLLVALGLRPFPSARDWIGNVLMLQHTPFSRISDVLPTIPPLLELSPLWTIAIEWWLYTLFGIIYFFHRSSLSARFLMLVLLVPSVLVVGYFSLKEYVAITWFAGAICAVIFAGLDKEPKPASLSLLLLLSFLAAAFRIHYLAQTQMNMYDIQLSAFLTMFLFCALLSFSGVTLGKWTASISAKLAFISYSLYLSHEAVRPVALKYLPITMPTLARGIYICLACIAVATAIALLLENKHLVARARIKSLLG